MEFAINIGKKPTFSEGNKSIVEAHLLDFVCDLYGNCNEKNLNLHISCYNE